jgi:hypothetical protein
MNSRQLSQAFAAAVAISLGACSLPPLDDEVADSESTETESAERGTADPLLAKPEIIREIKFTRPVDFAQAAGFTFDVSDPIPVRRALSLDAPTDSEMLLEMESAGGDPSPLFVDNSPLPPAIPPMPVTEPSAADPNSIIQGLTGGEDELMLGAKPKRSMEIVTPFGVTQPISAPDPEPIPSAGEPAAPQPRVFKFKPGSSPSETAIAAEPIAGPIVDEIKTARIESAPSYGFAGTQSVKAPEQTKPAAAN